MLKNIKRYGLLFIIITVALFLTMCELVHHDEPREPVRLDAFTSASTMGTNTIRIDSGIVYDTFAIFYTFFKDSYVDHFIAYGEDTGSLLDTTLVAPWPRTSICTLSNLKPYTEYIIQFRGELPSNAEIENHEAWGKFTTTKLSSHF